MIEIHTQTISGLTCAFPLIRFRRFGRIRLVDRIAYQRAVLPLLILESLIAASSIMFEISDRFVIALALGVFALTALRLLLLRGVEVSALSSASITPAPFRYTFEHCLYVVTCSLPILLALQTSVGQDLAAAMLAALAFSAIVLLLPFANLFVFFTVFRHEKR
jgi:hypothetical protein